MSSTKDRLAAVMLRIADRLDAIDEREIKRDERIDRMAALLVEVHTDLGELRTHTIEQVSRMGQEIARLRSFAQQLEADIASLRRSGSNGTA